MSAPVIIRALLLSRLPITDMVPADRIRIGSMPPGSRPSILITDVSGGEFPTVARNGASNPVTARIQVTVYARDYEEQERVLLACKLPGVPRGQVGNYKVYSVMPAGVGPAIPPNNDGIFERSRDFMVTFKEANL